MDIDLGDLQGAGLDLPMLPNRKNAMDFDRANLVDQTDPEKLISEIKHRLKGEIKNEEGEWYLPDEAEALLSDKGINEISIFLYSIVNKNIVFTKYDKEQIRKILLFLERDIIMHLRLNARPYKINGKNFDMIANIIISPINATYNRSKEGVSMDFIGQATKDIHMSRDVYNPYQMEKEGFLSKTMKKLLPPVR